MSASLRLGRRAVFSATLTLAFLVSGPARAQDKDLDKKAAAKEHYQRGTSYYDLARYQEAIKEFEAAYELKNDPAFLYNLAQSYRLAGDAENALRLYRTYLRYVPKPANRAEIDDRIKTLEQQIASKGSGITPPPGGGTTPPPPGGGTTPPPGGGTTAPPGGGTTVPPTNGGTNVAGGGATTPPGGETAPPPNLNQPPNSATPGVGMAFPPPPPTGRGRTFQTAGLITAGAGGLMLIIGIVEGLRASSASRQIEEDASKGLPFSPSIQERGISAEKGEAIFVTLGILAAAGGGALWYYGWRLNAAEANTTGYRISLTPALSPNGGGAWLRVRF